MSVGAQASGPGGSNYPVGLSCFRRHRCYGRDLARHAEAKRQQEQNCAKPEHKERAHVAHIAPDVSVSKPVPAVVP
jgi:hypothetical protein